MGEVHSFWLPFTISCSICLSIYWSIYLLIVGRLGEKILLGSTAKNVLAVQFFVWCVNDCQGSSAETDLLTDSVHMCVCVSFERGAAQLCHSLNTRAYRLDKVFSSACAHRRVHWRRHADHLCGYAKETHSCVCLQPDRASVNYDQEEDMKVGLLLTRLFIVFLSNLLCQTTAILKILLFVCCCCFLLVQIGWWRSERKADADTDAPLCLLFSLLVFLHSYRHGHCRCEADLTTSSSTLPTQVLLYADWHPSMGLYPQQRWSINPCLIQHFKNNQTRLLPEPAESWITINTIQKQQ